MTMRALTLTQPWAGLVASGIKLVENRPRHIIKREDFGKPFAIHASREIDDAVYDRIATIAPDVLQFEPRVGGGTIPVIPCKRDWYRFSRHTSVVIGVATIGECVIADDGDAWPHIHGSAELRDLGDQARWFFGPIGYVLRDVVALPEPVPCRGWQGFWTLPLDIEVRVREQLSGSTWSHI